MRQSPSSRDSGRAAWEGEEVVIARAGEPYLRVVPYREQKPRRRLGAMKGQIRIAPDFDETPPEVVDASGIPRPYRDARIALYGIRTMAA